MKQTEVTAMRAPVYTAQEADAHTIRKAVQPPFFGLYVMHMYEEMRRNGKRDREDAFMREQFEVIDDYIEQA